MAVAPKGADIHNEGTNLAHNLTLMTNPHNDSAAAEHFNSSAYRVWGPLVDFQEICEASSTTPALGAPKSPLWRRRLVSCGLTQKDLLSSEEWTALEGKRTPVGTVI